MLKEIIKKSGFIKGFLRTCFDALSLVAPRTALISEKGAIDVIQGAGFQFNAIFPLLESGRGFAALQPDEVDLSIVIPVYNAEKFLCKCLDSIVNQETSFSYEVICVNDGSTDNSLNILNRYAEENSDIVRVVDQPNGGISSARNKGIELARGRFVGFIDNDDFVEPNYIQLCMTRATATDSDIVQPGLIEELTNGAVLSKSNKNDAIIDNIDVSAKPNLSGYVWNGVIRKSLFEKVRFPDGFWYEDMIMVMLLFRLCKRIAVIHDHLYHKTIHETNASKILWNARNIKSVEKYWLARSLSEYASKQLNLKDDEYLYHSLLYEFRGVYFSTRGLPVKVKKALFSLCSSYIKSHKKEIRHNNKYLQRVEEAYLEGNYNKYVLTCFASRFS